MTVNDLVGRMAARAGELAAMTKVILILTHPDNLDGTKSGMQWLGKGKTELVNDILLEEFSLEFDQEIEGASF